MTIMLSQIPQVKSEMLIRRPVEEVFEAFANPEITTKFWFTKSSGRLEQGKQIRWDWEMYNVGDDLIVEQLVPNRSIRIRFLSDDTTVEWTFTPQGDKGTFVSILNFGFKGSGDDIVSQAIDSMGGFTMVLCAAKALLEHNVLLNVVADKAP